MEKFNRTLRGYDPDEVNEFLDQVIKQVEEMVNDIQRKDNKLKAYEEKLTKLEKENIALKDKVTRQESLEGTLNRAIIMAQKTSDQMRSAASQEGERIISEAKNNANRIVNEALLKAEKAENDTLMLRRNINVFKRRLRGALESQLEVIEEIEKIEL